MKAKMKGQGMVEFALVLLFIICLILLARTLGCLPGRILSTLGKCG